MSRYLDDFHEETIVRVLRAYLINGDSHRNIQKNILGLPAPARGGGFIAMDILHYYGIKGEHKGVLSKGEKLIAHTELMAEALNKVEEYNSLEALATQAVEDGDISDFNKKPITEVERNTKQRIGQQALRQLVLKNYDNTCALCDIHQSDLLVCSHIIPWTVDIENRLNPRNAIIFCTLHDSMFDKGYFGFDETYSLIVAPKADEVIIEALEGLEFKRPSKDSPRLDFLEYHLGHVCK